jgi:hypothetical protein
MNLKPIEHRLTRCPKCQRKTLRGYCLQHRQERRLLIQLDRQVGPKPPFVYWDSQTNVSQAAVEELKKTMFKDEKTEAAWSKFKASEREFQYRPFWWDWLEPLPPLPEASNSTSPRPEETSAPECTSSSMNDDYEPFGPPLHKVLNGPTKISRARPRPPLRLTRRITSGTTNTWSPNELIVSHLSDPVPNATGRASASSTSNRTNESAEGARHGDGTIGPFDTKTESKPGYNNREDWSAKPQAKIYLWALKSLYPHERVSRFVLDVVSRGSPKARRGPLFYRHDDIGFAPEAIEEQLRNLMWVADDIERSRKTGWWRSNTNLCKKGWEKCDYFLLHVEGRTEANLRKYRAAEDYLNLDS